MSRHTKTHARRRAVLGRAVVETLEVRRLLSAPLVDNFSDDPHELIVGFDQSVTVEAGALGVSNLTTGDDILDLSDVTPTGVTDSRTWQIDTSDGEIDHVLPRGNYEAILDKDLVYNATSEHLAQDYRTSFFSNPADANHDRTVDEVDDALWAAGESVGTISGYYNGDFNLDGKIDSADHDIYDAWANTTLPAPPTEPNTLTAAAGRRFIDLSWVSPEGVTDIDGFGLWRSTDGGADATFSFLAFVLGTDSTTYRDAVADDGAKFTYLLRAHRDEAGYSLASNKAWAVTNLPGAGRVWLSGVSATDATLTWTDNTADEDHYELWDGGTLLDTLPAHGGDDPKMTWHVSDLTPEHAYNLIVRCVTDAQTSADSWGGSFTTPAVGELAAPMSVQVTLGLDSALVQWRNISDDADSFVLSRRSGADDPWQQVGVIDALDAVNVNTDDDSFYTDPSLLGGVPYQYQIRAQNQAGLHSAAAQSESVITLIRPPTDLAVSSIASTSATLSWTDTTTNESGFRFSGNFGENGTGPWQVPAHDGTGTVTYHITGLEPSTSYQISVFAITSAQSGELSESVGFSTLAQTQPLPAPHNVQSQTVEEGDAKFVRVSWNNPDEENDGVTIVRRQPGKKWKTIATLAAGENFYDDHTVAEATTYQYAVYAKGSAEAGTASSGPSATAAVHTADAPASLRAYELGRTPEVIEGVTATWAPMNHWDASDPDTHEPIQIDYVGGYHNDTLTFTVTGLPDHQRAALGLRLDAYGPWEAQDIANYHPHFTGDSDGTDVPIGGGTLPQWDAPTQSFYTDHTRWFEHTGDSMTFTITASGFPAGWSWSPHFAWVDVGIPDVSIAPGAPATEGSPGEQGSFVVRREGGGDNDALTVQIRHGGGNISPVDLSMSPPQSITIPAGQDQATGYFAARDDNIPEGDEKFYAWIAKSDDYRIKGDSAELSIIDRVTGDLLPPPFPPLPPLGDGRPDDPTIYDPPPDDPPEDDGGDEGDGDPTTDDEDDVNNWVDLGGNETYGSTQNGDGDPPIEKAWWVRLNDDFDKNPDPGSGEPVRDNEDDEISAEHYDDELFSVGLNFGTNDPEADPDNAGTISLDFPDNVRVYRPVTKSDDDPFEIGWEQISSGETFDESDFYYDPQDIDFATYWFGWSGFLIDPIAPSSSPGDVEITASYSRNGDTVRDTLRVTIVQADLDVDSDNDNGIDSPGRTAREDYLEDQPMGLEPGKFITVNDDDTDGDGIVDYLDGFNLDGIVDPIPGQGDDVVIGEKFVPLVISVSAAVSGDATIWLGSQTGLVRIWNLPGDQPRDGREITDGGNLLDSGMEYSLAQLGGGNEITLWVEALHPSTQAGDGAVLARVDPDGGGPTGEMLSDSVRFTSVAFDIVSPSAPYGLVGAPQSVSNLVGWWPAFPFSNAPWLTLNARMTPNLPGLISQVQWASTPTLLTLTFNPSSIDVASTVPLRAFVTANVPSLHMSKTVWIDFPSVGDLGLVGAVLLHPLAAAAADYFAVEATEYAATFPGGSTGKSDAIQHAYWNALIAWRNGVGPTRDLTTAYEYNDRVNAIGFAFDSVMDLHNNEVGIAIGDQLRQMIANGTFAPSDDKSAERTWIKEQMEGRYQAGDMWIIDATNQVIQSNGRRIYR